MPRPAGHRINRSAWDDLLKIQGLSLTEVATRAERSHATVANIVAGRSGASVPVAHRIAAAVGVQPATLFPSLSPVNEAA